MEMKIHAGMRVLYKHGSGNNWLVGTTVFGNAEINNIGLYIPIVPEGKTAEEEIQYAEVNQIFWDAFPIDDWVRDYPKYFMTKEEYIKFIESEDFDRRIENAYVSDGKYGYYPISKYNKTWIEKQPFNYVVRGE